MSRDISLFSPSCCLLIGNPACRPPIPRWYPWGGSIDLSRFSDHNLSSVDRKSGLSYANSSVVSVGLEHRLIPII